MHCNGVYTGAGALHRRAAGPGGGVDLLASPPAFNRPAGCHKILKYLSKVASMGSMLCAYCGARDDLAGRRASWGSARKRLSVTGDSAPGSSLGAAP